MQKSTSAIILNRNNLGTLPAAIDTLKALGPGRVSEIIVVDMASTDKSRDWLEQRQQMQQDIQVLRVAKHSFARAANMGVRAATGERLLLLAGSVVPEGEADAARQDAGGQDAADQGMDWLEMLDLCIDQMEDTGIAGGRIITPTGRILSEGRSFITGMGVSPWVSDIAASQLDGPAQAVRLETDGVDPRLMLFDRSVFEKVGGFDESYQPQGLVVDDFCFGARFAGWRIGVCPAVRGVCYEAAPYPGLSPENNAPAAALEKSDQIEEAIIREHAQVWQEKWGINPLYVDLSALRELYGHSRVCWKLNEHQRFMPLRWPVAVDMCMVTWNSAANLDRCLESLAATDYPAELLTLFVVDNGSTDDTMDKVAEWSLKLPFEVRLHHLDVNTGAVPAMNLAMGMGAGALVVKMDDDIRVPPDWLRRLSERFLQRPYAGVVGAKILDDTPEDVIQCGPISHPPFSADEEGQKDRGQVDQVERCLHVRGCCCLYRRDALRRVGPMDVRYAPSQFDDIDHHVAFWNAGFEVIYDGSVSIYHKRNTGSFVTRSAWGSATGNGTKFYSKWSQRGVNAIDIALNCSKEGRLLRARPALTEPDFSKMSDSPAADAANIPDTANAPEIPFLPRPVTEAAKRVTPVCLALSEMRDKELAPLAELGPIYLFLARQRAAEGATGLAFSAAGSGLSLCPAHGPLLLEFSSLAAKLGNHPLAAATRRRALSLGTPEAPAQDMLVTTLTTPARKESPESANGPLAGKRILIGCQPEAELFGQGKLLTRQAANALRKAGATVTEWSGHAADLEAADGSLFDFVHLMGFEPAFRSAALLKAARQINPGAKVILTPMLQGRNRAAWAEKVMPRLFREGMADRSLEAKLGQLASGAEFYGVARNESSTEAHWGYREVAAAALASADILTHADAQELRELRALIPTASLGPTTSLRPAASADSAGSSGKAPVALPFLPAVLPGPRSSSAPAGMDFGSAPFVLCLGALTPPDNMLMLCAAAQANGLRVVHLGLTPDAGYLELCRRLAPNALFWLHADEALVSAALAQAAVYAAPGFGRSWPCYGLAAALSGKPVLLAAGQPETAVLGDAAFTADPYNLQDMATALGNAAKESGGSARLADAMERAARAGGADAFARQLLALYME